MVYVILQHTAVRTERTISKRWEMSYRDETKDNKLILLIALLHPKKKGEAPRQPIWQWKGWTGQPLTFERVTCLES